jgi:hypothetical protein
MIKEHEVYTTAIQDDLPYLYTPIEMRTVVGMRLRISMVSIALCHHMSEDHSLLERDTLWSWFEISMVGVAVLLMVLHSTSIPAVYVGRQHTARRWQCLKSRAELYVITKKKANPAPHAERLVSRK